MSSLKYVIQTVCIKWRFEPTCGDDRLTHEHTYTCRSNMLHYMCRVRICIILLAADCYTMLTEPISWWGHIRDQTSMETTDPSKVLGILLQLAYLGCCVNGSQVVHNVVIAGHWCQVYWPHAILQSNITFNTTKGHFIRNPMPSCLLLLGTSNISIVTLNHSYRQLL